MYCEHSSASSSWSHKRASKKRRNRRIPLSNHLRDLREDRTEVASPLGDGRLWSPRLSQSCGPHLPPKRHFLVDSSARRTRRLRSSVPVGLRSWPWASSRRSGGGLTRFTPLSSASSASTHGLLSSLFNVDSNTARTQVRSVTMTLRCTVHALFDLWL